MSVYVASALATVLRARHVAERLRELGVDVTSTWHDVTAPGSVDPITRDGRAQIAETCLAEVRRADVVLALVDEGAPRGTFVEAGYQIGRGRRVIWVAGPHGASVFDAHGLSSVVASVDEAIGVVVGQRDRRVA